VPYLTLERYEATGMVEKLFGVFSVTAQTFQLLKSTSVGIGG
jgi:hypothetical protein